MSGSGEIRPREQQFCIEYLLDGNGTRAAIRAGYAPGSAHVAASRLLARPRVRARIAELRAAREMRTQVTADRVVKELAKVAFGSLAPLLHVDAHGQPSVDPSGLTPEMLATLRELWIEETRTVRGNHVRERHKIRVRQHDKVPALRALCQHLGLLDSPRKPPRRHGHGGGAEITVISNAPQVTG